MYEADGGGGGGAASESGDLFTPPPGDPGTIRSAAKTLSSHGTTVGDLGHSAKRSSSGLADDFRGEAADAYGKFAGGVEALATGTEEPVSTIARGIDHYADALDAAQKAIRDAAHRHAAAQAASQKIADDTNSNPNRTDAQVTSAQAKIDKHDQDAKDAEQDARRAWKTYEHESQAAAKTIKGAGDTLDSGTKSSPVKATLESMAKEAEKEEGGEEPKGFWKGWEVWENVWKYGHEMKEGAGSLLKYGAYLAAGVDEVRTTGSGANLTYTLGQALSSEYKDILKGETVEETIGEKKARLAEEREAAESADEGEDGEPGEGEDGEPGEGEGASGADEAASDAGDASRATEATEAAEGAGEEISGAGKVLGAAGKVLGPVGVITGGVTAVHEFAEGKKADGAYDAISTGLGAAALMTPPPADLACGAAAGTMALVKIVDPHIADQAVDVAKGAGHLVSDAASGVKNFVGSIF